MAKPGVTGKTSRWGFLIGDDKYERVLDALKAADICAAISPLHDLDEWDRAGIVKYMRSWESRREGVRFFFDPELDRRHGFTSDDVVKRTDRDMPCLVAWPELQAKSTDAERYEHDEENRCFYAVLPSPADKKKPHYHVQVYLSYAQPRQQLINALALPEDTFYYWEPVDRWQALLRYYAHMDSPDKARYRETDVTSVMGFDLSPLWRKSEAEKAGEFEYIYSLIRSMPSCNLLTLTDALIQQGHSEIALSVKGSAGYWKEILYQNSRTKAWSEGSEVKPSQGYKHGDYSAALFDSEVRPEDMAYLEEMLSKL